MLKQQHQLFASLLVAADAVVVAGAACTALMLRRAVIDGNGQAADGFGPLLAQSLLIFVVPVTLLSMRSFGLYRPRRDRSLTGEIVQLCKACVVSMLALLAILYAIESPLLSRGASVPTLVGLRLDAGRVQIGALAFMLPFALATQRVVFRVALRSLRRRGWNLRHVAVIGVGRLGQICARTLERNSWTGIRVAYFIGHQDHTRRTECMNRPVLGGLADLETTLEASKPDAVYVALPSSRAAEVRDLLARLSRYPVDVRVVPDISPRYLPQSMAVNELDGMPVLSYRECPMHGMGGLSKRIIDIFGSLAALALFSPVMLLVAAAVRMGGAGPVIFRQQRVSLGGQVFNIYKFRTMRSVQDESATALAVDAGPDRAAVNGWTARNDPRITPFGRFLRRCSLDELPQLFNVLRGDMSLVGPRPERPELIARFREDWRGYMLRQHVKAGMTGWAQVNGLRGQTSLRKRIQYDLFYVRNWSVGFDMRILFLTLFRGFVHRNAH